MILLILLALICAPTPVYADTAHAEATVIIATTCTVLGCDTPKDSVQPEVVTEADGGVMYVY